MFANGAESHNKPHQKEELLFGAQVDHPVPLVTLREIREIKGLILAWTVQIQS